MMAKLDGIRRANATDDDDEPWDYDQVWDSCIFYFTVFHRLHFFKLPLNACYELSIKACLGARKLIVLSSPLAWLTSLLLSQPEVVSVSGPVGQRAAFELAGIGKGRA